MAAWLHIATWTFAAEPPRPEAAKALFEQGRALVDAGDWQGGCAKFDESLTLQPKVSTLIKVARCRAHEGKLATASKQYDRARALNQQQGDNEPSRRAELDAAITRELGELAPRVPMLRIVVHGAPSGLTVRINADVLAPSSLGAAIALDPGEYLVTAEAPGFARESKSTNVKERTAPDQVLEVSFQLTPTPATPAHAPASASAATVPAPHAGEPRGPTRPDSVAHPAGGSGGDWSRTIGWAVGGVGLAGLGVAAVLGVMTLKRVGESEDHCGYPGETCSHRGIELLDQARGLQTAGLVVAGISAAAVITGVTLVLTSKRAPARSTISIRPAAIVGEVRW